MKIANYSWIFGVKFKMCLCIYKGYIYKISSILFFYYYHCIKYILISLETFRFILLNIFYLYTYIITLLRVVDYCSLLVIYKFIYTFMYVKFRLFNVEKIILYCFVENSDRNGRSLIRLTGDISFLLNAMY